MEGEREREEGRRKGGLEKESKRGERVRERERERGREWAVKKVKRTEI